MMCPLKFDIFVFMFCFDLLTVCFMTEKNLVSNKIKQKYKGEKLKGKNDQDRKQKLKT